MIKKTSANQVIGERFSKEINYFFFSTISLSLSATLERSGRAEGTFAALPRSKRLGFPH